MAEIISYTFADSDWHNLMLIEGNVTVKSVGGSAIQLVINLTGVTPTDAEIAASGIDPIEIGGLINEITTQTGEFLYGRAVNGTGTVTVRPEGTIDPTEDISYLGALLLNVQQELDTHKADKADPHDVTKDQVGLGQIPNAKSDDPSANDSEILATTKATQVVIGALAAHVEDVGNVHGLTKADIGLGNVQNYRTASDVEGIAGTATNLLMTPHSTAAAVNSMVQIAYSMSPQTIMTGVSGTRLSDWTTNDCSLPSAILQKLNDTTIAVMAGLSVCYAENGKARQSAVLDTTQNLTLPVGIADGLYYIYTNLSNGGAFSQFALTNLPYKEGMIRDGHIGDFFSVPECKMYDAQGASCRRVYLGKCYVSAGKILSLIPNPIGIDVIIPATTDLVLGGRDLYDNPFVAPVDVYAEVEYNFTWGKSEWNDQIGVKAHPYPTDNLNKLILQCGMMGFIACGREAGSPFGASFAAITTAPRARMRVRKKFY